MSINKYNYKEAGDYIFLSKQLGATNGCIIPVMLSGRAKSNLIVNSKQILEVLNSINKVAETLQYPVSLWCMPFAGALVTSKYISVSYCRTWKDEIEIDPKGNVLLCDILDITFSNVIKEGFYKAWIKLHEHSLYKFLINPTLLFEPCINCRIMNKCKGGCYARAALSGDIYKPDPLCPIVSESYAYCS